MVNALSVGTHTVHADNVALVFNRARDQQTRPRAHPCRRPVGHVHSSIVPVFVSIPAEHRKAQVVADLQEDAPTPPLDDYPVFARAIGGIFAGEGEQVPFVIELDRSVGRNEKASVHRLGNRFVLA